MHVSSPGFKTQQGMYQLRKMLEWHKDMGTKLLAPGWCSVVEAGNAHECTLSGCRLEVLSNARACLRYLTSA